MISVDEQVLTIPLNAGQSWLDGIAAALHKSLPDASQAIRLAVVGASATQLDCEVGVVHNLPQTLPPLLHCNPVPRQRHGPFVAALVIPTGIGAEIGGHDGDAGAVARLVGSACDHLVTHPNVVNASDLNEMPANTLYVEGSILSQFLMGTIGLQPVRSNRLLVLIDQHEDNSYVSAAVNMVNAARATWGLDCSDCVVVPEVGLHSVLSPAGRAVGRIKDVTPLLEAIAGHECDAIAVTSVIDVPRSVHETYFASAGDMVNPWGGVEAMLTHLLSAATGLPTAHAPMLEDQEIELMDPGIVDPRMAAEAVSITFLHSVLKGLHRSPRIVPPNQWQTTRELLTAGDVDCLVIPDRCIGIPTLAALAQGYRVIAVTGNRNLMQNDLDLLPWRPGQLLRVHSYPEAVGIMQALHHGIAPATVQRPLPSASVHNYQA